MLKFIKNPTEMFAALSEWQDAILDIACPEEMVRTHDQDLPWFNSELKDLSRKVKRKYKEGKDVEDVIKCDPTKANKQLKKLASRPGDCSDANTFQIQSHIDEGLTDQESADRLATFFAQISQEFLPLDTT